MTPAEILEEAKVEYRKPTLAERVWNMIFFLFDTAYWIDSLDDEERDAIGISNQR
jgi:hypothetical protein